ncbi:hypothetical protein BDW67DRAFT_184298 [Aspergillus spinulosporus]
MPLWKRKITVSDDTVTSAVYLTMCQSLLPYALDPIFCFLWRFTYGLPNVLNSHFQTKLHITASKSSGLHASYFGITFFIDDLRMACA